MTKVASYCRVSTDRNDQTNSFEAQQRYFREYIAHHPDWELAEVYADEGITGTSTKKRAQFNRMVSDAYAGKFQLIITKEVSRFSRNILDTIAYTRELKAIGVAVLFVLDGINTMNPDAELYLSIMASLAQEESRKTSSRVVWGQTRQMERGVVFGHSLLGYDLTEGKLSINPEGANIVRLIFEKYAVEQVSTSEIARFLTGEGYSTSQGTTKWKPNTVIKILNNEKYVGDLIQKKTYTPDYLTHEKQKNTGAVPLIRIENHHEPIISREVWNLAQKRLKESSKQIQGKGGQSKRYLFSGKIRCGKCGAYFTARYKYRKDGTRYRRWCCATAVRQGTIACDVGKLLREDDAIHMLKTAIRSLHVDSTAIISNVTELAISAILAGEKGSPDPQQLLLELRRIQKKKVAVMDSFFSGDISREDMKRMNQHYDQEINTLHQRISTSEKPAPDPREQKETIHSAAASILNCEADSELFLKSILDHLTVFKDRHIELTLAHLPQVFRFEE